MDGSTKDWEDLQHDCSLFPAYTDYVNSNDDGIPRDANHNRETLLGTAGQCNGLARPPSLSNIRNWIPPEEQAAHYLQAKYGPNRAFYNSQPSGPLQDPFRTPTPTSRSASRTPQLHSLTPAPLQTPCPLPAAPNRNLVPGVFQTPPSTSTPVAQANPVSVTPALRSNATPASFLSPLTVHDPDAHPQGLLRPNELFQDRYNWITLHSRHQINEAVKRAFMAAKNPFINYAQKREIFEKIGSISNQVEAEERKWKIKNDWVPKIFNWLRMRQQVPWGSPEYEELGRRLSSYKPMIRPEEEVIIQQGVQALIRLHGMEASIDLGRPSVGGYRQGACR